jgi:hypothetical protein
METEATPACAWLDRHLVLDDALRERDLIDDIVRFLEMPLEAVATRVKETAFAGLVLALAVPFEANSVAIASVCIYVLPASLGATGLVPLPVEFAAGTMVATRCRAHVRLFMTLEVLL